MMRTTFRRTAPRLGGLALCLPLLVGACSKSTDTSTSESTTTTAAAAINAGPTIGVSELKFDPAADTVQVGKLVTWSNNGSAKHQIQEEGKADGMPDFSSEQLKPGDKYQFTPTVAGSYTYYCRIHPDQMRGTLTVTP